MLFMHLKDLAAEAFKISAQFDHHQTMELGALEEEALMAQRPEYSEEYSEERAQQEIYSEARAQEEDYSEERTQADMLPPDLQPDVCSFDNNYKPRLN